MDDKQTKPLNRFEAIDLILEFISRRENKDQMFDADGLKEKLFPSVHIDKIQALIELIDQLDINPAVAKVESSTYVEATEYTRDFLDDGGLTKAHQERTEKDELDQKLKKLELEKGTKEIVLLDKSLKDYKMTKWMSRIAFAVSLILAFLQIREWIRGK